MKKMNFWMCHLNDRRRQVPRLRNFFRTQNGFSDDRLRMLRQTSRLRRHPAPLRQRVSELQPFRNAGAGRRRRGFAVDDLTELIDTIWILYQAGQTLLLVQAWDLVISWINKSSFTSVFSLFLHEGLCRSLDRATFYNWDFHVRVRKINMTQDLNELKLLQLGLFKPSEV